MRFDVCAAAPFDARRVPCQVMRFDECVFITAVPNTKLCAWGEEDSGGHVLL